MIYVFRNDLTNITIISIIFNHKNNFVIVDDIYLYPLHLIYFEDNETLK